jgi:hypothetical protein
LIAGNPAALKEIRDKSENSMARVAAIKTAEALREIADDPQRSLGAPRTMPGLVVVIESSNGHVHQVLAPPLPPPLQIEHEPEGLPAERE